MSWSDVTFEKRQEAWVTRRRRMPTVHDRLVAHLSTCRREGGCFLPPGDRGKYHKIRVQYDKVLCIHYVHRLVWEMHHGDVIPDGLVVRHACDTPACCEPAHLLVGTMADNARDMVSRGRDNRWGWKGGRTA